MVNPQVWDQSFLSDHMHILNQSEINETMVIDNGIVKTQDHTMLNVSQMSAIGGANSAHIMAQTTNQSFLNDLRPSDLHGISPRRIEYEQTKNMKQVSAMFDSRESQEHLQSTNYEEQPIDTDVSSPLLRSKKNKPQHIDNHPSSFNRLIKPNMMKS